MAMSGTPELRTRSGVNLSGACLASGTVRLALAMQASAASGTPLPACAALR